MMKRGLFFQNPLIALGGSQSRGEADKQSDYDIGFIMNGTNAKLSANWHPNKQLQELWNKYGPEGFELSVVKVLKYNDPSEDHTAKLESLREQCLASNPNALGLY